MDSKEFADEKFGFNAEKQPEKRFYGLIEDPIKQNTPEELERLDEIYSAIDKQYLPASSCNVQSIYGQITGNYNLKYTDYGTGKSFPK